MSFLPTRTFAPYTEITNEEERDLGLRDWNSSSAPADISPDSTRDGPSPALNSFQTFGRNMNPFSKKDAPPAYTAIELGNITEVSSSEPQFHDDPPPAYTPRKGWRKGILWASGTAVFVLVFNILFLSISYAKHGAPDGVGTLYAGNCAKASHMDSGIHVVINIMGTILLGASNYVMQILGAPTRRQVDKAHAMKSSLFIGVPNLRNLRWVGRKRLLLWFLLAISALPLHLFWNSSVFSTLQANQYDILVVSNKFIESDTFDCNLGNLNRPGGTGIEKMSNSSFCSLAGSLYDTSRRGALQRLDKVACMKAYSADFLSGRRNLLAVSNDTGISRATGTDLQNGSIFNFMPSTRWQDTVLTIGGSGWQPNQWICSAPGSNYSHTFRSKAAQTLVTVCDTSRAIADQENWKIGPNAVPIDYCLSEIVPEVCQLQFIVHVLVIVIVCNTVKVICMLMTLWTLKDRPLVVIGDAIASFLKEEDEVTKGQCLTVAHQDHKNVKWQPKASFWTVKEYQLSHEGKARTWGHHKNRWFVAPKAVNWILCVTLCVIFLAIASILLHVGIISMLGASWNSLAFSSVSPSTMITWFSTSTSLDVTSKNSSILLLLIIITNTPQLLFSWLYFIYNALYTSMLSAHEILQYVTRRRALRVSYPTGHQRSTYWLQLPLRYSFPLVVISGFLHWLISQSLFIARISFFDALGEPAMIVLSNFQGLATTNVLTLPGYSPKALIASIVVGVTILAIMLGTGLRKFEGGMPVLGNDSWALSAACHGPKDAEGTGTKSLSWGVVDRTGVDGVGHCSFSSSDVERPIVGQSYA